MSASSRSGTAIRLGAVLALIAAPAAAQRPQTSAGEYTVYELLAPGSGQFRIFYDVSATTAGATYFFNPIRKGSEASDERVHDRVTGSALSFDEVDGATARRNGHADAALDTRYIQVRLARPVPVGGAVRILIDKTYRDPASYRVDGNDVVFERSLGIKRNAVILPAGYELVSLNVPSQVQAEADGRIRISFINISPAAAPLVVRGRKLQR